MSVYSPCLLDTDILSELLKGHPTVKVHAADYLSEHGCLTFSQITQYEILKGLESKKALKQLEAFRIFCQSNVVVPLTESAILQAAKIYAELREAGHLITDADILVAAIALSNQLILVTNNTAHFNRIKGLTIQNWKR